MDKKNITEMPWGDNQLNELSNMKDELLAKIQNQQLDEGQLQLLEQILNKKIDKSDTSNNVQSFEDYAKWKKIISSKVFWDKELHKIDENWTIIYCVVMNKAFRIVDFKYSVDNIVASNNNSIKMFPKITYIDRNWVLRYQKVSVWLNSNSHCSWQWDIKVFSKNWVSSWKQIWFKDFISDKRIVQKHISLNMDYFVVKEWEKLVWCIYMKEASQIVWFERITFHQLFGNPSSYSIEFIDKKWNLSLSAFFLPWLKNCDEIVLFSKEKIPMIVR